MATSILEQIALNLVSTLQGITTASYENTVARVTRPGIDPANNQVTDKALVLAQDSSVMDDSRPQQHRRRIQTFIIQATVVESGTTALDARLNSLIGDIEKALMVDRHRSNLANNTTVTSWSFFDVDGTANMRVALINVDVEYTHLVGNPFSQ